MNRNEAFGKALRRFRLAKKLMQDDFTVISSRAYISILERGKKSTSLEKIDELAALMDVHPVSLIAYSYLLENKTLDKKELISRISKELKLVESFVQYDMM